MTLRHWASGSRSFEKKKKFCLPIQAYVVQEEDRSWPNTTRKKTGILYYLNVKTSKLQTKSSLI
jgi:hypothetical protein